MQQRLHLPSTNQIEKRLWEAADELRANSRLRSGECSMPVPRKRASPAWSSGRRASTSARPINDAMRAIEAENEDLRDVLPKTCNRLSNDVLACGSGGMFVQSARFVEEHQANPQAEIRGWTLQRMKKGTDWGGAGRSV